MTVFVVTCCELFDPDAYSAKVVGVYRKNESATTAARAHAQALVAEYTAEELPSETIEHAGLSIVCNEDDANEVYAEVVVREAELHD